MGAYCGSKVMAPRYEVPESLDVEHVCQETIHFHPVHVCPCGFSWHAAPPAGLGRSFSSLAGEHSDPWPTPPSL